MRYLNMIAVPGALLLLILFAGCAATSPHSTFFELRPVPAASPQAQSGLSSAVVGVGPIRLAERLDRPQLVTHGSGNELKINEYHRWVGSLQNNLSQVLATNLASRLNMDQVVPVPWVTGLDVDYRVAISIYRLDGYPGGEVRLQADWVIVDRNGKAISPVYKADYVQTAAGSDVAGYVRAQEQLVATLSDAIAERLKTLNTSRNY